MLIGSKQDSGMLPEAQQRKWVCRHFQRHETVCKCGCKGQIIVPLQYIIDKLRAETAKILGNPNQYMLIASGFRCETDNKRVGGAPNSQHKLGKAVDIVDLGSAHKLALFKAIGRVGFYTDTDKNLWEINYIEAHEEYTHIDIRANHTGFKLGLKSDAGRGYNRGR